MTFHNGKEKLYNLQKDLTSCELNIVNKRLTRPPDIPFRALFYITGLNMSHIVQIKNSLHKNACHNLIRSWSDLRFLLLKLYMIWNSTQQLHSKHVSTLLNFLYNAYVLSFLLSKTRPLYLNFTNPHVRSQTSL